MFCFSPKGSGRIIKFVQNAREIIPFSLTLVLRRNPRHFFTENNNNNNNNNNKRRFAAAVSGVCKNIS